MFTRSHQNIRAHSDTFSFPPLQPLQGSCLNKNIEKEYKKKLATAMVPQSVEAHALHRYCKARAQMLLGQEPGVPWWEGAPLPRRQAGWHWEFTRIVALSLHQTEQARQRMGQQAVEAAKEAKLLRRSRACTDLRRADRSPSADEPEAGVKDPVVAESVEEWSEWIRTCSAGTLERNQYFVSGLKHGPGGRCSRRVIPGPKFPDFAS